VRTIHAARRRGQFEFGRLNHSIIRGGASQSGEDVSLDRAAARSRLAERTRSCSRERRGCAAQAVANQTDCRLEPASNRRDGHRGGSESRLRDRREDAAMSSASAR